MSSRVGRRTVTPVGVPDSSPGSDLAQRVDVLVPEPDPEPRVDQGGVGRRDDHVVRRPALLDPARRGRRVEIPCELGLADGLPCRLDPHVRAPAGVVAVGAEEESDGPRPVEGDDAGGAVGGEQGLDLRQRRSGILVARGERGLGAALGALALREQAGGAWDVVGGERDDLEARHGDSSRAGDHGRPRSGR